jgi:hypothetical protein
MLNLEYPNFEKKSLDDLDLSLSEPIKKINIRGKKKKSFLQKLERFYQSSYQLNQIRVPQINNLMLYG